MKLEINQTIDIAKPPAAVWAWVSDPRKTPLWNPHCKAVAPLSAGEPGPDWRFHTIFQLSSRPTAMDGVVAEWEPPRRLVYKLKGPPLEGSTATESYRLEPMNGGTRLEQLVVMETLAIPWWARLLILFVKTFGKEQGQPMLDRLRELVENDRG